MSEPPAVGGLLDLTGRVVVGGGRNGPREGSQDLPGVVLGSSPVENPNGYCPDHSTGVSRLIGLGVTSKPVGMELLPLAGHAVAGTPSVPSGAV